MLMTPCKADGDLNLLLPGPSERLMSDILLWLFILAFPHHFLSPQRSVVIAVLVPSYATLSFSSQVTLLPPPPGFPFSLFSPLSPMSLIPSFLTRPSHSSVLSDGLAVQLIWGGGLLCVSEMCVCVSVWLVADKTSHCYPLRHTCVAMMIRRPHTHSILQKYTRMHFNMPIYTRIYLLYIGHSLILEGFLIF